MTISDPPTLNLFFLAMADADAEYQDKYEHYNYDQDKAIMSGHSGKQRTKKEVQRHKHVSIRHNPEDHDRLPQNMEKNKSKHQTAVKNKLQNMESNRSVAAWVKRTNTEAEINTDTVRHS